MWVHDVQLAAAKLETARNRLVEFVKTLAGEGVVSASTLKRLLDEEMPVAAWLPKGSFSSSSKET